MMFSDSAIFIPHIYIPVMFILLLTILLGILLLAPFNLSLNVGKKGPLVWGSIRLAWLGLTLRKVEIMPQSVDDLLVSIRKEEAGKEERALHDRKTRGMETAAEKKNEPGGKKDREQTDNETTDTIRSPSIQSLIDVAPALMKILWDLLKSIRVKKSSCRLCFGLNDPAQTAIVSGYLWFLASALGTFSANISIDPWFEGERLEGEIIAKIEARLIWPVFAVIKALRVREIRLLMKEMLGWT
jgi:hypothetical protein